MPYSGGYIPNNFRQGYRAEYLAKYILSEFGPCERINPENDYGLDLIATIMKKVGTGGFVSSMYGIQVKSGEARFHYSGEQLIDWLRTYNIPVLMCRAIRDSGTVKLYSTWTIHHLVLQPNAPDINEIDFIENYGDDSKLRLPEIQDAKAKVWLGQPIVEISVAELQNESHIVEIQNTLAEWVGFDAGNYYRRNADIPVIFGYLTWHTNKSLATSQRTYYKPYYFGWNHTTGAIKVIQECATLIALNQGKDSQLTKDLAQFVKQHGIDIPHFTSEALGI